MSKRATAVAPAERDAKALHPMAEPVAGGAKKRRSPAAAPLPSRARRGVRCGRARADAVSLADRSFRDAAREGGDVEQRANLFAFAGV